jgi:uncharacterized protein (DUF2147 family)
MRNDPRESSRRPVSAALLGVVLGLLALPRGAHAATAVGLWYAEGGAAQVEVYACGEQLCGRVVWLRSPFDEDGCELRDRSNPDPELRDRPIIGIEVLTGLRRASADREWTGGAIYDPVSGRTYRCTLEVVGENRVQLQGYIGVPLLGRTTTWIRVGSENQMCRRR